MFIAPGVPQPVNPILLEQLTYLYTTDPIMRSARSVILMHLSRDKLRFTRGGNPVKISRCMQLTLDTIWQRFIEGYKPSTSF
jgi:hypothetical protein